MMNLLTRPAVLAAAIIMAITLGCKLNSANSETSQNAQQENHVTLTPARVENANVNASNASPTPAPKPPANAVCPDPARPCQNKTIYFDEWALSFKLPVKPLPNKTYRSAQFYGIILKVYEGNQNEDYCDGGEVIVAMEDERKQLQQDYPDRKVFASYDCPNMGATDYDFPGRMDAKNERVVVDNFIAIYAGQTKEDAERLLAALKPQYPKAVIKPMTALAELIVQ